MIVREAIEEYVAINDKQWQHDRSVTVGASEIGQCARKVWATKFEGTERGVERDADYVETWGARWRGNIIENNLLVPAIKHKFGSSAYFMGAEQKTFFDGRISATLDCLIDSKKYGCFILEFKSIDPRAILHEPKMEHVYQTQVQLGIINTIASPKWRPQYAILSYTDASFLNETKEFVIEYDADVYRRAKVRAAKIMHATDIHELEPEGWISGGKECEWCPFVNACGSARRAVPEDQSEEETDPQFIAEITDAAQQLKNLEAIIDYNEETKRSLQNDIKERLREKNLKRVVGHGISISWSPVKGRDTIDMEALRAQVALCGVDIDTFKTAGQPGDRLTITMKKEEEPKPKLRIQR